MKTAIKFLSVVFLFTVALTGTAVAQDDVYYDPNKDKGLPAQPAAEQYDNNNQNPQATENNTGQQETDKTDGYGNPADKYDPRDSYNNSTYDNNSYATDAGYYDEDYDSYFYTTRLRRYYTPSYGTSYYSYWYTPSYYIGYNNWNTPYVVSYSPWYNDPWWRWNRTTVVVGYDPFYSPYWGWNNGWNSSAYYNSWSNPYGGCFGYGGGYGGYGGWGYGSGCGYGGGWGYGGGGYQNGYYNGYNHGYYNGYNDGYWNSSAYNNNGYNYYGPRHRSGNAGQPATGNAGGFGNLAGNGGSGTPVVKGSVTDIPREGVIRPTNTPASVGGVRVEAGKPYESGVVVKPGLGGGDVAAPVVDKGNIRTNTPANLDAKNTTPVRPGNATQLQPTRNNDMPVNTNSGKAGQLRPENTRPFVRENSDPPGWHDVPADRNVTTTTRPQMPAQQGTPNTNLQQRGNNNAQLQQNNQGTFQSRQNNRTEQPLQNGNSGFNNRDEQRTIQQQRPANVERNVPQQRPANVERNFEQRNSPQQIQPRQEMRQQNFNSSPQQQRQPQGFGAPQQRGGGFNSVPQGGGGKGFGRQ